VSNPPIVFWSLQSPDWPFPNFGANGLWVHPASNKTAPIINRLITAPFEGKIGNPFRPKQSTSNMLLYSNLRNHLYYFIFFTICIFCFFILYFSRYLLPVFPFTVFWLSNQPMSDRYRKCYHANFGLRIHRQFRELKLTLPFPILVGER